MLSLLAYSDLEDSSQMFGLRNRSRLLWQDKNSVTHYFNSLTKLWRELDLFDQHSWKDLVDADIYQKLLAKKRSYDFWLVFIATVTMFMVTF